jgi:argininosuccinate synthase
MKVVLAYSGGLDTSICVKLLQEKYDCDVITVTVDVGLSKGELKIAEEKVSKLGVLKHKTINAKEEFSQDYIFKAIKANASYEGYPLSTALARPCIADKVVQLAKNEKADALAHGATGKGNDQFRFESVFRILAPQMKIIAPIRELNLTRLESIEYANRNDIPIPVNIDNPYSVDENIWGRSIEGGILENPSETPPEEIYKWTKTKEKASNIIEIEFKCGVPVAINGELKSPADIIEKMNTLAGNQGIGRIDMIEDRILGIKARENYECPAAVTLLKTHEQLEQLVLTRQELKFKKIAEQEWSELVYKGLWFDPLRFALDAFIDETQKRITGKVKVKLHQGSCMILERSSPFGLYSKSLASFDDSTIDQRSVEGILYFHSLQSALFEKQKKKN